MLEEIKSVFSKEFLYDVCDMFSMFKTSFVIAISIIVSTVLFIVDDDPPKFPLPESYTDPIDCFNIVSSTINIESSRIKVTMQTKDFIQFPNEVATSLVHIKSNVGDIKFRFNKTVYWDLQSDLRNISFCVLQTAGGIVNASLYCQNILLGQTQKNIQTIPVFPVGWSRIQPIQFFSEQYNNICIDSKLNLVFCSKQEAEIGEIHSSWSHNFPVSITPKSQENYQNSFKLKNFQTGIVVPFNNQAIKNYNQDLNFTINPQDFLLDAVLPIIRSKDFQSDAQYLLPNQKYQTQLKPVLAGSQNDALHQACYTTLLFLPSTGFSSKLKETKFRSYSQAVASHFRIVSKYPKEVFTKLRSIYPTTVAKKNHFDLVIDQGLEKFADHLKSSCSEKVGASCSVFIIHDQASFTEVSNIVSSSSILLASNAKTILIGSLLKKGSRLIYVHPDNLECFDFKNFSSKLMAEYQEFKSNKGKCICKSTNLTCYFDSKYQFNYVDKNLLSKFVWTD